MEGDRVMMELKELCLEITNRCVMRCLHCSTASPGREESVDELSLSEIQGIISDFHFLGGEILEISGGEPTLHPHLIDIISFAKGKGLETRLYTCGVSLKGKCRPLSLNLLKQLREKGLDKIVFNVQGAKNKIHDLITATPGSFNALCKSIKRAKELGVWAGVHFVPMLPNAHSFEDVLRFSCESGIDEVAILRFVPQGRGEVNKAKLRLSSENLWEFLKNVSRLKLKFEDKLKIRTGCPLDFLSFLDMTVKPCTCKAGKSTCSITPKREIIPCPGFKHFPEFVAGNTKEKNLREIWINSEVFKEFQKIDYQSIAVCSECERNDICKGRCPAQRVRHHGNLSIGPDPDCPWSSLGKDKPYTSPLILSILPKYLNYLLPDFPI
jgi:radical SAM protein with 4Fe4S-binding SPASM domain